ncbi:MAG: hypothetical protein R3E96_13180 [Planctomycetota bacterium]
MLDGLAQWHGPRPYLLHGYTGVGKTLVLREIERLRPGLTLDLEGLAGHRARCSAWWSSSPAPEDLRFAPASRAAKSCARADGGGG